MGGYNVGFTMEIGKHGSAGFMIYGNSMYYLGIPHLEHETLSDGSLGHADQLHSFKSRRLHCEDSKCRAAQMMDDGIKRADGPPPRSCPLPT